MYKLRIADKLNEAVKSNKIAFIPFIVAGDPTIETSIDIIMTLQTSGADIIEVGIPYSDPLADGPIIQQASKRALKTGMTLHKAIEMINSIKDKLTIPVVIFTYYNPVLSYGLEKFVLDVKNAGFHGVLIPDLPVEESETIRNLLNTEELDFIMLVTPTSGSERIKKITDISQGFVYLVSITGVTGARSTFSESVESSIEDLRKFTHKPICIGFGISKPEHIEKIKTLDAQGAIVGSALIAKIEESIETKESIVENVGNFATALSLSCKK